MRKMGTEKAGKVEGGAVIKKQVDSGPLVCESGLKVAGGDPFK